MKTKGTIMEIRQETPSVKIIGLKLAVPFDFKPGQFVMVSAPGYVDKIGRGPKRAYSIASAPGDALLELVMKVNPAPCLSAHIDSLGKGDILEIDGPYGRFFLELPVKSVVFIAGGTGIAPLISMVRFLCRQPVRPRMKVLFGVKTAADILYRRELDGLEGVEVVYCLSREDRAGFVSGRVTAVLKEHVSVEDSVYVCGSPQMVADVVSALRGLGVSRVYKEQW